MRVQTPFRSFSVRQIAGNRPDENEDAMPRGAIPHPRTGGTDAAGAPGHRRRRHRGGVLQGVGQYPGGPVRGCTNRMDLDGPYRKIALDRVAGTVPGGSGAKGLQRRRHSRGTAAPRSGPAPWRPSWGSTSRSGPGVPNSGGTRWRWATAACSSSGRVVSTPPFPVDDPADFSNTPHLICSNPDAAMEKRPESYRRDGRFRKGDLFILATDAVACWDLTHHRLEEDPWTAVAELCYGPPEPSSALGRRASGPITA